MKRLTAVCGAVFTVAALSVEADELDLIPDTVLNAASKETVEDSYSGGAWSLQGQYQRRQVRHIEGVPPSRYQAAFSVNGRGTMAFPRFPFFYDANIQRVRAGDNPQAWDDESQLNLKQWIWRYDSADQGIWRWGRINLRSGVAFGFNPTDYFRAAGLAGTNQQDAQARRDNRLGNLGLHWSYTQPGMAYDLFYAPKVQVSEHHLGGDKPVIGLHLNDTNPSSRWLLRYSRTHSSGLYQDYTALIDEGDLQLGANMSQVLSQQWLLYGEVQLSHQTTLRNQWLNVSQGKRVRTLAAVGASFSSERNITTHVEYHYSGIGLRPEQLGDVISGPERAMRAMFARQSIPLSRHYLWLRAHWQDPFPRTGLSAMGYFNLDDHSRMLQLSGEYHLNDTWSTSLRANRFMGAANSEFGSSPQTSQVTFQLNYFF